MKPISFLIISLFLVTLSGFSQVENINCKSFQFRSSKIKPDLFGKSQEQTKTSASILLLNSNETSFANWSQPNEVYRYEFPIYNSTEVDQKINDYKFKAYSCSGQNIQAKSLIIEMVQDEITNYFLYQILKK